jgi:hypothetical protein
MRMGSRRSTTFRDGLQSDLALRASVAHEVGLSRCEYAEKGRLPLAQAKGAQRLNMAYYTAFELPRAYSEALDRLEHVTSLLSDDESGEFYRESGCQNRRLPEPSFPLVVDSYRYRNSRYLYQRP